MPFKKIKFLKIALGTGLVLGVTSSLLTQSIFASNNIKSPVSLDASNETVANNTETDQTKTKDETKPESETKSLPSISVKLAAFKQDITFAQTLNVTSFNSPSFAFSFNNNNLKVEQHDKLSKIALAQKGVKEISSPEVTSKDLNNKALYFQTPISEQADVVMNNMHLGAEQVPTINNNNLFKGVWDHDFYNHELKLYSLNHETTFNIDASNLNPDHSLTPSEFISNKQNYENKIKFSIHNALPATLNNASFVLKADDANGRVLLDVTPGAAIVGQNDFQVSKMQTQTFVLATDMGISRAAPGDVLRVPWSNTYFNDISYDASYFKTLPQFEGQFLYPSAIKMEWARRGRMLEKEIKMLLLKGIANQAPGTTWENIVDSSTVANDAKGTLTVHFYLSKYIDSDGVVQNETPAVAPDGSDPDHPIPTALPTFDITVIGFKKLEGPTSLPDEHTLEPGDIGYDQVYDLKFEDSVKKLAISLIQNSPVNFELPINDSFITPTVIADPEHAHVEVQINFQGYFDADLNYVEFNMFSKTIVIKGFKSDNMTEINTSNLKLGDPNNIAQAFANEDAIRDDIIMKNNLIVNPSPSFNEYTDIEIQNIAFDNRKGQLSFTLSLTRFNDREGYEQTGGFEPKEMVISGYKMVTNGTKFASSSYDGGKHEETVFEYGSNPELLVPIITPFLVNSVEQYTDSFPATVLSIAKGSVKTNTREGKITLTPLIKNYFSTETFEFLSGTKELPEIEITGFMEVDTTTINTSASTEIGNPNILPSEFWKNNQEELKSMLLELVQYKVPNMTVADINIQPTSTFSNLDGTITVDLTFNRWYSNQGQLMTSTPSEVHTVTISGFRKIKPTAIVDSWVVNMNSTLASDAITEVDALKKLVLNNLITNIVPGTTIENINLTELHHNNLNGQITFKVSLNKFFNSKGLIYDSKDEFVLFKPTVTISGYKIIVPTQLPEERDWNVGISDQLPSDLYTNLDYLKAIVLKQISGDLPLDFDYLKDIEILTPTFSNLDGTIRFQVNLTKYYDKEGNFSTTRIDPPYFATLTGYKTVSATGINASVEITGVSQIAPSSLTPEDVKDLIYNNFNAVYTNLPIYYFTKTDIIIGDTLIPHNNLGIIEVSVSTITYYDSAGELVLHDKKKPLQFQSVKLFGFSRISETIVNNGVSLPNQESHLPTDFNDEAIVDLIFKYKSSLFIPLPTSFTKGSIKILNRTGTSVSSVVRNNLEGTITMDLQITNYYNSYGVQDDTNPKQIYNFTLRGFKATSQTYVDTTVDLKGVDSTLASEITNEQLLKVFNANINDFVRSKPATFEISSVSILSNSLSNLMGTLIAEVKYINYYDANGVLVTDVPKTVNIRCYGFEKATPTIVADSLFVPGKQDLLPSSENAETLKQIIWNNRGEIFENLPPGVELNDIEVQLNGDSFINSQGQIDLTIKLYRYYNELANLISGSPTDSSFIPLQHQILLSGYNSISPTTIKENVIVHDAALAEKIPTDITPEDIKQYIFDHRDDIITSIPPDFALNNIIVSDKLITNNDRGSIYAKVTLSLYYDDASQLQNTATFEKTVVLYGFKKNLAVTYINPVLYLNSSAAADIVPQQLTYKQFVKYVYDNKMIVNAVSGFDPEKDIYTPGADENPFVEINNLQGYVTAKISLNRYYDSHGNVAGPAVNGKPRYTQIVTIYGFKQIRPTYFVPFYQSKSFSHKIPSDETDASLLKVIRNSSEQFIKDPVVGFNAQRDIVKVVINDYDNIEGTVTAVVYLNNYYNDAGNIVNVGSNPAADPAKLEKLKPWNITFAGYKTQTPTSIAKTLTVTTFDKKYPALVTADDIADYLILNQSQAFRNLPDTGISKDNIKVSIISTNNLNGQILADVKLYKYINSIGQEVTPAAGAPVDSVEPLTEKILLKGFATASPTTTIEEISPIDLSSPIGQILPSDISKEQIAEFIITQQSRIIINNPVKLDASNFNASNIVSNVPNNLDGTLKIKYKLNNYYNSQGEFIKNAAPIDALNCNITLTNLKKSQRTTAVPSFNNPLPVAKLPQFLYQDNDYLKDLVYSNKDNIFTYAPTDLKKEEISISGANFSNLTGTITFFITLSRFYDSEGNLVNATADNGWTSQITITGFNQIKPTIFTPVISLSGVENIVPTDFYASTDMKKLIYDNRSLIFSNLNVSNPLFNENSISINNVQPVNSDGKVIVNYSITNFYDKDGVLSQNQSANQILEIQGFASRGTTTINANVQDNLRTLKPSQFLDESSGDTKEYILKNYIYDNLDSFFTNLPTGKDANTKADINVSDVNPNDKDGIVVFTLSAKNYYNDTGILKTDGKLKKSVVLSGFATQPPTYIGDASTVLNNVQNSTVYADIGNDYQTVDEFLVGSESEQRSQLLSLIRSSVMNTADPTDPSKGIIGFKSFYIDHNNATVTVTELRVTNFYEGSNGLLVSNHDGVSYNMIISGFKKTATAELTSGNIMIYVALGIASAFLLGVIIYFVVFFIRRKYLKI